MKRENYWLRRLQSSRDWDIYAAWRIQRVLKAHIVCNMRELEARISEHGPLRLPRPEPVHVTNGKNILVKKGTIKVHKEEQCEFYSLSKTPKNKINPVLDAKKIIYGNFINICQVYESCGKAAELLFYRAMIEAKNLHVPFLPGNIMHMNGKTTQKKLDLAGYEKSLNIPLGIEVKNEREWVYPDKQGVWETLGKCAELEVVPILITRRISWPAFLFFKQIGLIGHQTYKQYFNPACATDLNRLNLKNTLGFADIVTSETIESRHVKFFNTTIPKILQRSHERFQANLRLIKKYAIDRGMWNETLHPVRRGRLFKEFSKKMKAL